nr:hypothetical protein [Nostoc sp. ChiSLP01]
MWGVWGVWGDGEVWGVGGVWGERKFILPAFPLFPHLPHLLCPMPHAPSPNP